MNLYNFERLSPSEKKRSFHELHGPECYRAPDRSLYYPDGAVMQEGDTFESCLYFHPPDPSGEDGEYLLAWRKLQFAKLKLSRSVNEFDHLNTQLAHTRCFAGDEEAELRKLRQLQTKVNERKELVAQAESALENTRKGKRLADHRRAKEEEAARIQEFQSRRSAIRI